MKARFLTNRRAPQDFKKAWSKIIERHNLDSEVRLGRFVEKRPADWNLESAGAQHHPYICAWRLLGPEEPLSDHLISKLYQRVDSKIRLRWDISVDDKLILQWIKKQELGTMRQIPRSEFNDVSKYAMKGSRHSLNRNREHDKLKWPIYNSMLVRHDEIVNNTER